MRLYCDRTVPAELLQEAQQKGVQVMMMPDGLSEWELNAVEAWINSGRWFHVMRDWWSHTDPVLAGMWGSEGSIPWPDSYPPMPIHVGSNAFVHREGKRD